MAQTKTPMTTPGDSMKMSKEDLVFGVIALIAIAALVLYMN